MSLKDAIGNKTAQFIFPYMQNTVTKNGGQMPKASIETDYYKTLENYLWFKGNEADITDFYKRNIQKNTTIDVKASYYYTKLDGNMRIVHSGLPSLISYGKANLLFSGGVEQTVYTDATNETKDEEKTALLKAILKENRFKQMFITAGATESWSGKVAFKLSVDKNISDLPIIQVYSPLQYQPVYKYGRLIEIMFKTDFSDKEAYLIERYGYGYITHELFQKIGNNYVNVALGDLEETAELEDKTFDDNFIFAFEKTALKSDYEGITSEFDAIDEAWSQLLEEVRNGRAETYIPENLLQNKTFNQLRKQYVILNTDMREGATNEVKHNQPEIRADELINAIIAIRANILANVMLSPLTLGIDEGVGANASGDALEKREIVSLRTRKQMVESWSEFLSEFCNGLINCYNYISGKGYIENFVKVKFGEYISPSIETKIKNAKDMVDSSIIDTQKALEIIFDDDAIGEDELNRILANTGEYVPEEET